MSWGLKNFSLIKGWFQDTVPTWEERPIAVLRLDGDLYESTKICLEYLYPMLSKGGILIIDDWDLSGCVQAFDEYFEKHEKPEFILKDWGTYWRK